MTATGNLSRGVVAEMCDRFSWPEFDKAGAFQFHKVINEPDFLPLYFVRHIAQAGTLLRKHKGHLKISPAGRRMLQPPNLRALQAVLFHITMWHFDLGNLGWGLHGWPQRDAGVVLWSLSSPQTTGNRVNVCRVCARSPSMVCWTKHGIRLPMRWRRGSFDLFSGSGFSNIGRTEPNHVASRDDISIARPRCSIASTRPRRSDTHRRKPRWARMGVRPISPCGSRARTTAT